MAPLTNTKPRQDARQSAASPPSAPNSAEQDASGHVTQHDVETAVRTLIRWAGDDPDREGLAGTPARVAEAFREYFKGYREDPLAWLDADDVDMARGYDDIVMLRNIQVHSFCEHHMTPFEGRAHVAYLPAGKAVGLSRLARVVETLARRLQTQEALTDEIASSLASGLEPRGVAVLIEAEHQCMSLRGIRQSGVGVITTRFSGVFEHDPDMRQRFMQLVDR